MLVAVFALVPAAWPGVPRELRLGAAAVLAALLCMSIVSFVLTTQRKKAKSRVGVISSPYEVLLLPSWRSDAAPAQEARDPVAERRWRVAARASWVALPALLIIGFVISPTSVVGWLNRASLVGFLAVTIFVYGDRAVALYDIWAAKRGRGTTV
jgi:hypothetical protein